MKPTKIERLNLENLGNFPGHIHVPVWVGFEGVFEFPNMDLKLYTLHEKGQAASRHDLSVERAADFIAERARREQIHPLSGLGYVMLSRGSEGIINVVTWGQPGKPYLPGQAVFAFRNRGKVLDAARLQMKDGSFCAFEYEVNAHEGRAWRKYLASISGVESKTKLDMYKRRYLIDVFPDSMVK